MSQPIRYTNEQKSRMTMKLAAMKSGQRFLLNKIDIENSLEVKFFRGKKSCRVETLYSGLIVAKAPNETALVGKIIDALGTWPKVLEAHFEKATAK